MISIQKEDIDIGSLIQQSRDIDMGAQVVFVGTVRDDGIEAIEFEADRETAIADLRALAAEAMDKFGLISVDIIHRDGLLEKGETILVIIAGAAHREEGFDGCRFIIEEIKRYVPIWKKDITATGESHWHD
ncbi:molybdenum cofactor biosynthesis protein MoaE [Methanogenium organophilum]|uniref:Molybdenum cofactor biosynthesis protein MoaE n=1 Tax=Methanogenium organophilum TaxID=2199 RepID=A0A9X9S1Q8_METOG|nr:molybdenum cofactor biosynthesis protein MoaE [Methanogenium organophilum]WAI00254.1 molybdenum cofactor biosynthesis protein MoaE [Methanogenium organophilum]